MNKSLAGQHHTAYLDLMDHLIADPFAAPCMRVKRFR